MLKRAGHEFVVRNADLSHAFAELRESWSESKPAMFILDSVDQDKNAGAAAVLNYPGVYSFVIVDDPEDRDVRCDLLMNALPGNSARAKTLARQFIRGTEFLILPLEYEQVRERAARRKIGECRHGFAFFGGSDPENLTGVFLDMVAKGSTVREWLLLLGPANPFADEALNRVKSESLPLRCERYVPSMAETLLDADLAILAAGNTVSEAAAVGTPVIALSHHGIQKENAEFYAASGGVVDLGLRSPELAEQLASRVTEIASSQQRRTEMSKALLAVVDGQGGRRVAGILSKALGE